MSSRRKAIFEYRRNFPTYCNYVSSGGLFGYGTHLETLGGEVLSIILDKLTYHEEFSRNLKGIHKHIEFSKSLPYVFLTGVISSSCFLEMLIETPIRKLTGKTKF